MRLHGDLVRQAPVALFFLLFQLENEHKTSTPKEGNLAQRGYRPQEEGDTLLTRKISPKKMCH
jgi:hypothetical protein